MTSSAKERRSEMASPCILVMAGTALATDLIRHDQAVDLPGHLDPWSRLENQGSVRLTVFCQLSVSKKGIPDGQISKAWYRKYSCTFLRWTF